MNRRFIGLAAVAIVLIAPIAMLGRGRASGVEVQVTPAEAHAISVSTLASGVLAYERQTQLSPEIIGRVIQVAVREGDRVVAGQVVMTIDDRTYRSAVAQQAAAMNLQGIDIDRRRLAVEDAQIKFERAKMLVGNGYLSRANYDDARLRLAGAQVDLRTSRESLQQAQAALSQARDQLSRTLIRAPMGGTVIALNIKEGETAVPSTIGIAGSSLMVIGDTASLIAEVAVNETDIARVHPGQRVILYASSYPDTPISGVVTSVSLSLKRPDPSMLSNGPTPRSYTVKVAVHQPPTLSLRHGMTTRAEIISRTSSSQLTVPVQSVFSSDDGEPRGDKRARDNDRAAIGSAGGSYVFVLQDGRAKRRKVRLGDADDEQQEILTGLKRGEMVITGPYKTVRFLKDGDAVSVGSGH